MRRRRSSAAAHQDGDEAAAELRVARLSDTGRVEAFSDGVYAIIITLLVLDLGVPEVPPGQLRQGLLDQWPAYVAYVVSFLYVGIVWQTHHAAFTRIRYVDRGLHWWNLAILFTSALLPFPTAVMSYAIQRGAMATDARTAVALYALVGALLCTSWYWFVRYLATHAHLLEEESEAQFFRQQCGRVSLGIALYLVAGVLGVVVSPVVALIVFFVIPALWGVTSQGLAELHEAIRRRPLRRRRAAAKDDV
jgi:uncharacterized membrane protein